MDGCTPQCNSSESAGHDCRCACGGVGHGQAAPNRTPAVDRQGRVLAATPPGRVMGARSGSAGDAVPAGLDRLERQDARQLDMLARGERDLLALAAERDGRYELAGRLRWGPDGMIGRLASQPPGSSRCYHGVRVDRAENGEWTVHHPPGSPRHANLNEVPGFSACDPNLASATLAADSIRGALTRVDGATLTPYRTRRSRNRLLGTDTTSLFVEGDLAAIGMAALRTDGGGYGAMARHPGELGGLMELGTHASRREAQEAIIAYLEAPETAVETVAAD